MVRGKPRPRMLPDRFIDQSTRTGQRADGGLDNASMVAKGRGSLEILEAHRVRTPLRTLQPD